MSPDSLPIIIRTATPQDAPLLLQLYSPYVKNTPITFEYEVPSQEEFRARMEQIQTKYPYLVATQGNNLLGYAYASVFKGRAAYNWSVETSIYLATYAQGKGIGRLLYEALELYLKRQNITNINACITFRNPQSIAFHEKAGFKTVAHFHNCGYKLGAWYDMIWMEKLIAPHLEQPADFIPFPLLEES